MIEAGILVVIALALMGGGLAVWHVVRGPTRRRFGLALRATAVGLVVLPLVLASTWQISRSRTFQIFGELVTRVDTDERIVALTFDDGPSAAYTEEVLDVLRELGVRATFFVNGWALEDTLAQGQQIVAEGHELGNHSYSHARMWFQPLPFVREEIERTDDLIRQCGYEGEIHFRAPYAKRFVVLPYYLAQTGRKHILWDVEPESYSGISGDAGEIADHVLQRAKPGSIVLLHVMSEGRSESREALPGIIQGLRAQGFHFVTISSLLGAP